MLTFQPGALRAVTHLIARRMGSDEGEATEVADHLVRANLAGHDLHGVGMLPTYVRLLHDKLLVPNQTPETVLDAGALLIVDARRGYGQRMAADAVRRAIGKAREHGACVLGLRDSAHIGRIGTYAELAVGQGCAWISFVNVADHRDVQATFGAAEPRWAPTPSPPPCRARTGSRCCSTWPPRRSPPARRAWPTTRASRCPTTA